MDTFGSASWQWGELMGDADFGDGDRDGEEGDTDDATERRYNNKDSVILLIDCTQPMFESTDEGCAFELCIKCAKSVLMNKIISSDKDLIGIVFFGTEKHQNSGDFKNVFNLQDLGMPDAERILELERLLEDDDSYSDFSKTYGHSDDFSLSDALWCCSMIFSNSKQKIGHKRVLLFTNSDDPHAASVGKQRQAKKKAEDLFNLGIEIEIMHMNPPNGTFDFSKFYQDVLMVSDDEMLAHMPDPAEKFDELLTRVRSKDHKRRAMMRIPFSLGEGVELAVGVYVLVRRQAKSSHVWLDSHTNQEVKTVTKYLCEDTGTALMPTDIKYYQEFGGEKVIFESEEVKTIRTFGKPGLHLLGFKPRRLVKMHHHIKGAHFLHPDESLITGSGKLANALLQRMVYHDVVAICKLISRANAAPRFVALLPQEEELDGRNVQIAPPGFHVVHLPFADDLRKLKYEETPRATVEQVEKAKEVVKKLTFKFNSENFENPVLQKHHKKLEALALDRDSVDDVVDLTEPDSNRIKDRAGRLLSELSELVYPADYDPAVGVKPAAKRKASSADAPAAKRARKATSEGSETINMRDQAEKGTLIKLTVPVLKDFLKSVDLPAVGKKAELVDRIKDHFGV